jgi:hypothetical protein
MFDLVQPSGTDRRARDERRFARADEAGRRPPSLMGEGRAPLHHAGLCYSDIVLRPAGYAKP